MSWSSGAPSKLPKSTEMSLLSSVGVSPTRQRSVTYMAISHHRGLWRHRADGAFALSGRHGSLDGLCVDRLNGGVSIPGDDPAVEKTSLRG